MTDKDRRDGIAYYAFAMAEEYSRFHDYVSRVLCGLEGRFPDFDSIVWG